MNPKDSIKEVFESFGITQLNLDSTDGSFFGHPRKQLARDIRQNGAGQDMVDVACAGFGLATSTQDVVHDGVGVDKCRAMVVRQPLSDPFQLKLNDISQDVIAQRVIRHNGHSTKKCGFESFQQFRPQLFGQFVRFGPCLRIGTQGLNQIRTDIRRAQNNRILQVDFSTFSVFQDSLSNTW